MLQDVNAAEGDVLQQIAVVLVVAVTADVDRVRHTGPERAVLHEDIPCVAVVLPAAAVDCNSVVRGAKEAALHMHAAAAHGVDAIAPALAGEAADAADGHILRAARIDCVVRRVDEGNPLNEHIPLWLIRMPLMPL